jgi:hypothetical protein
VALVAALGSLAFEGPFRGCGAESSAPSATLPEGEPPECFVDTDCTAEICNMAQCVAGTCRQVPQMTDADFDGATAAPCGTDCDDTDPTVGPRFFEICDSLDNDCDTRIDEDAMPMPVLYTIGADVRASGVVDDLPGVVLLSIDPVGVQFELVARWFDLTPTAPFGSARLATFEDDGSVVQALPVPGGLRVLWSSLSDRVVRETTLRVTRTERSATIEPDPTIDVVTEVDVTSMRATETAGGYVLLLETIDDLGTRTRSLVVPGTSPLPVPYEATLDLASRDMRFYVPAGASEIAVLNAAGDEVQRVVLPGELTLDPLTSWNGRILAVSRDASSFSVSEITSADTLGDSFPLEVGFGDSDIALHPLASALAVTRVTSGLDVALYDETLARSEAYFGVAYSATGIYAQRGVYETGAGLAVIVAYGPRAGSAVIHLQCR